MKQIELSAQRIIAFIPGFNCLIVFIWLYHLIFTDIKGKKRIVGTVFWLSAITLVAVLLSGLRETKFPETSLGADMLLIFFWYVYFIAIGLVLVRVQRKIGIK